MLPLEQSGPSVQQVSASLKEQIQDYHPHIYTLKKRYWTLIWERSGMRGKKRNSPLGCVSGFVGFLYVHAVDEDNHDIGCNLDDDARKVDSITTTFDWTGGEFGGKLGGIRRNKPRDWDYFCDNLRMAHERDADRFKGKCEVAIKLQQRALLNAGK